MKTNWEIRVLKNKINQLELENAKLKKSLSKEKMDKSRARVLHIQR